MSWNALRGASIAAAATLFVVGAHAQGARRSIPTRLREALVGCWDLGDGETYVVEAYGAHGLRARWEATGRAGTAEAHHGTLFYLPDANAVTGGCGAQTQHGQHCVFELDAGTIRVTTISEYSGRGTQRTIAHCGAGAQVPDEPEPAVHPVPVDAPISDLLARRRRDIDASHTPTGESDGWTRYGDDLAIRFDHAVAMRVRRRLTATTCDEAATLAGFATHGTSPLRRATGCEWPGISERHRLAPHVAGRWTAADGVMEIWRTE